MGLMDTIFGSKPKIKSYWSEPQQQLSGTVTPYLQGLFGPNAWQNLLPTESMMQGLSGDVMRGLQYPIEQGANQLQERLGGMGFTGGTGGSAMAQYYANAQPQVYSQLANMIGPAARFPYSMAGSLFGQTTPTPVVKPGSPGLLQSALQVAAPLAMGAMFGPLGMAAGGLMGGMGGGLHNPAYSMYPPT